MTGDPKRHINLGINWNNPNLEPFRFSFDSFTFPACKDCNDQFSLLESQTHWIVEAIFSHSELSVSHWDTFLDWLDKVRIGLWLAKLYLNKNKHGLKPNFHIERRVGTKDRFVIIYEIIEDGQIGISWGGTETPLFEYSPSCFVLTINNFLFFNASYDFLFSKRLGFPFPSSFEYRPEGLAFNIQPGTGKIQFPLVERDFKTGGTQLFQPMIPYKLVLKSDGDLSDFYDNPYVRENCMDFKSGRGRIFRRDRYTLKEYRSSPSLEWKPKQRFLRDIVMYETQIIALEFLEELSQLIVLPQESKVFFEEALKLHSTMLDLYRKSAKP